MSKPIKITDTLIESMVEEFVANLKRTKMFDGKIDYTKSFKWDGEDKAYVVFSPDAFAKMTMLVQRFDSEVAWHGVAYRDEIKESRFYISDILVYPQVVTGSTVNTDQDKYQDWLYEQEDEVFNNIRMQGHSHVNFSTTPSGVDTTHQEKILTQLDEDMFYIFMIWNKKFERTIKIFDLKNNTLYENGDVEVAIGTDGVDLDAFIKDAKAQVVTKTYQPANTTYQYNKGQQGGSKPGPASPVPITQNQSKNDPKSKPKNNNQKPKDRPAIGRDYDDDDWGDRWGGYYRGYTYNQ